MSRWLLVLLGGSLVGAVAYSDAQRAHDARPLGGECTRDRYCQQDLRCADVPGVLEAQCTAPCSSTLACQERFGERSLCIGIDRCVRTCDNDADCPAGTSCNDYQWCEAGTSTSEP